MVRRERIRERGGYREGRGEIVRDREREMVMLYINDRTLSFPLYRSPPMVHQCTHES